MIRAMIVALALTTTSAFAHEIDVRAWNICVEEIQSYQFQDLRQQRFAFDACYSHKYALLHHLPWGPGTLPER